MEQFVSQLLAGLKGMWQHRWLGFCAAWLVASAGWAKVYFMPDVYQTTARVFVDTQNVLKPLMMGMTTLPNIEQQVAIMSRTLLSRPNIERVLRMVDLDVRAATARAQDEMVEELLRNIRIQGTGAYDIYTISYQHSNPLLVRDVVRSLLAIFVEGSFKGKRGDSDKAVQFIDDQIRSYEDRLQSAENTVKEFRLKHDYLLPPDGQGFGAKLASASEALAGAQLELAEARQVRQALAAQLDGDEPVLMAITPANDTSELASRISALDKNLDSLRLQYTEHHPDVLATLRLIDQLKARQLAERQQTSGEQDAARQLTPLFQQLKVAVAEADARVAALEARVATMTQRQALLQQRRNEVPELESQLAQLNRDYLINKENYEKLIARRESAKLSGELSSTTEMMSFKIIDPPTVPQRPIGPNRALNYSLVLLGALVAGVMTSLAVSQLRPTFVSGADLRSVTGLRLLGSVSMNWTDSEKRRLARDRFSFFAGSACLLLCYAGVMSYTLLIQ